MKIRKPLHYIKALFFVAAVILVFALLDFLAHGLSESFAVPEYYFKNKIIFGIIYGFAIYLFTEKMNPLKRALVFSGTIAVLLQVRYYLEGYAKWFVFLFLGLHFLMLLAPSLAGFWISKKCKLASK